MTAVTIALSAAGGFTLTVPSTLEGRSHVIQVPGDESGVKVMRKVLVERQKAFAKLEIGHAASPTQAMVQDWLRQDRLARMEAKARAEEEKENKRSAEAKALIGDLDLGELDL